MDIEFACAQSLEDSQLYYYMLHEKFLKIMFPYCSYLKNKRIDKMVCIFDMSKTSVLKIFTKV